MMLHKERGRYTQDAQGDDDASDEGPALSVGDIVAALRRQLFVLLTFAALGFVGGGVFLTIFKPAFQATATILIDTRRYPETPHGDIAARTVYDSSAAINTQVEILTSQTLARAVVEKLSLWQEIEFVKTGGGVRATVANFLKKFPITQKLAPFVDTGRSDASLSPEELRSRAIAYLMNNLTAKRVGDTFAIDITFQSRYADVAAKVANATAEAFIAWQRDVHHAALTSAGGWLEERINDLRQKSIIGQKSVSDYQSLHNIFDGSGDDKRLTELSTQLDSARSQVGDAQAKLNQLNHVDQNSDNQISDLEIISAIENVANDASITALRLQYLELTARYEQLRKILQPNHKALIDLRGQMQRAHDTLIGELARVRLMLKNNRDTAQVRVDNIQNEIAETVKVSRDAAAAQAALKQLQVNAQTYQSLYDSFLRRYVEALQANDSPAAEAAVISSAEAPPMRNYKKALVYSAAVPVIAMLLGACVAFFRERVGRPFWTSREVQNVLRLPCSDVIPELTPRDLKRAEAAYVNSRGATPGGGRRMDFRGGEPNPAGRRAGLRNANPIGYYALLDPMSRFAESLRSIRLVLKSSGFIGARRTLGITSAMPNEGKSSIALALAMSIASAGVKIVLVDCDLRNPSLTKSWLGVEKKQGLVDVLRGDATLDDVIQIDPDADLHFVPSGLSCGHREAGELIISDGLETLMCELRGRYDLVIVDLPPLSPVNDVASTQTFIEGYLLVIEWGKTRAGSVSFVLERMPHVHNNVVSVVLNKVDMKKLKKFGFDVSDYYFTKYAGRYIST